MEHIEILLKKLPHKHSRSLSNGTEIRVLDLEGSVIHAQKIIEAEKLKLKIGSRDIRLRSFIVHANESE
ncbi:hypothetical protein GCM10009120_44240 [Sphingobacterium siyangense subsp. cladoniae]|uniref:hypothetical protein n=1 Tax=Sphingobacterium siyangense TaxID=459529 RepID=UPI0031F79656